jgi:hypothetical protein
MRRWDFARFGAAIALLLLVGGCGSNTATRFRLTAKVETPQGVRTGSSVIEVVWHRPGAFAKSILGSQASGSYTIRGEAVAVDLPGGQTLFLLLRSPADPDWPAWVLGQIGHGEVRPVPRRWRYGPGAGTMTDNYPWFVRFGDITKPETVEEVDSDDLAASFGDGYALKALTFQHTNDAVTAGIRRKLYWLSRAQESTLEPIPVGGVARPTIGQTITLREFVRAE